jgi:hypothetical protein
MSFEKYILEIKTSNGQIFKAEKIQITPASLEKQLERAFYAGFRHCEDLKKDAEKTSKSDIFSEIFGR